MKNFHGRVLAMRVFSSDGRYELTGCHVFPRKNIIASRDQYTKENQENLVMGYNSHYSSPLNFLQRNSTFSSPGLSILKAFKTFFFNIFNDFP